MSFEEQKLLIDEFQFIKISDNISKRVEHYLDKEMHLIQFYCLLRFLTVRESALALLEISLVLCTDCLELFFVELVF